MILSLFKDEAQTHFTGKSKVEGTLGITFAEKCWPFIALLICGDVSLDNMLSFLFDEDPLLTKTCRKCMAKKGDPTRILKPKKVEGMLVAQRDIVLRSNDDRIKS